MKKFYTIVILLFFCTAFKSQAQDVQATTADGKKVVLHDDGTWTAVPSGEIPYAGSFKRPAAAKEITKGKRVKYSVRYDKAKWKIEPTNSNEDAEFQFVHESGEAWAVVIPERMELTLEALRQAALENAKSVAADAQIVSEDERAVNGLKIRCVQINGTVDGIPITYFNYYYTGKAGSVQFVTYTSQNLFDEMKPDFLDLLNGLEIM